MNEPDDSDQAWLARAEGMSGPRAVVSWSGGQRVIPNCRLGDPRVGELLKTLARVQAQGVKVVFEDDF